MTDLKKTADEALRGRRSAARSLWARVAAGDTDPDLQRWLQAVASRVLQADEAGGKHRGDALAAALGLRGTVDRNAEIRDVVSVFDALEALDPVRRGHETKALVELLRQRQLVDDLATDDEIRKRVDRIRKG